MAIVSYPESNQSLQTYGVVGRPWGAGLITAGYSFYGDDFPYSGIYQRRRGKKGQIVIRMKHYRSPNPQTDAQQEWRAYFAYLKTLWDVMSESEKDFWRASKPPYNMGGWNRFASYHLKNKTFWPL